jgi:HD superfamily phosphohydrolase YqeK
MNKKYFKIVKVAQEILVHEPFDLAHEITHHYRVYENAIKIIEKENLNVESEFIAIAAWWHDILDKNVKSESFFQNAMISSGYSKDNAHFCLSLISEHSFGNNQSTISSKVLFDADKIEYINPLRLQLFLDAANAELISREMKEKYFKIWHKRIPNVKKQLHFDYSRKIFDELYPKAEIMMSID